MRHNKIQIFFKLIILFNVRKVYVIRLEERNRIERADKILVIDVITLTSFDQETGNDPRTFVLL